MLGRKDYTRAEFDDGKTAVDQQLAAYRRLVMAVTRTGPDKDVTSALEHFETRFFNNMALVLDRYFVHRVRMVAGKDGNPLNELTAAGFERLSSAFFAELERTSL